jgi:orotate phosphoribosyltransferase
MTANILNTLPARRGHFLLESGYHSDVWFNLDAMFLEPDALAPLVDQLADLLRPHNVSAICGPLLGGAFLAQALAMRMGLHFYYTQPETARDGSNKSSNRELFNAKYLLPADLRRRVSDERVAIVDDVISAGSSVRATAKELADAGATIAVVGTIMLLGNEASRHFLETNVPLVSVTQLTFNLWPPDDCPLCDDALALENPVSGENFRMP